MKRTKSYAPPDNTNEEKPPFGFLGIGVPVEALCNEELTNLERLLFGLIRNLSATEKGCWASNRYLGRCLLVQPQTISNGIAKLLKLQYIITK
jgi:hypothetical protein